MDLDPITKKEFYLSILGGGEYPFPTPITREEKYLAKLAGLDVDVPNTITRKEKIMGTLLNNSKIDFPLITRLDLFMAATNDETIVVPEPVTREEQFWAKIALSYVVTATYDGPLPVALYTVSGSAEYKIYGAATGVGERTAQLIGPDALDPDNGFEEGVLLRYDGRTAQSASFNTYGYIAVEPETTYYRRQSHNQSSVAGIWFYDSEKNYISAARLTTVSTSVTTPENCAFVRFSAYINLIFDYFGKVEIINEENIPPYGYVLPLTVSGGGESVETPLYIGGEPLEKGEYADSESGKIYRLAGPQDPPAPFPQLPTFEGSTTFSCSCAPGPERAEISYKTLKKAYISADDKVYQDPNGELLGG